MANPPKKKGTGGETELVRLLAEYGIDVMRNPASARTDLSRPSLQHLNYHVNVLATRPDRGQWLMTVDLDTFARLVLGYERGVAQKAPLDIEVKRYARFSLHTIFQKKFGGKA